MRDIVSLDPPEVKRRSSDLFAISAPITHFDSSLESLVLDLLETMHEHQICVGVGGAQVRESLRVAVVNSSDGKSDPDLILINPEILAVTGKKDIKMESCRSFPDGGARSNVGGR